MLSSVWRNTIFNSEMLTNPFLPFLCNSCYIPTLIARYSDNLLPSLIPPKPVLLTLYGIYKNIPHIHTITSFTNGLTKQSHTIMPINLTTNHYHHPHYFTKSNISSPPLTRQHSCTNMALSITRQNTYPNIKRMEYIGLRLSHHSKDI